MPRGARASCLVHQQPVPDRQGELRAFGPPVSRGPKPSPCAPGLNSCGPGALGIFSYQEASNWHSIESDRAAQRKRVHGHRKHEYRPERVHAELPKGGDHQPVGDIDSQGQPVPSWQPGRFTESRTG